jgi:hypothetical protein
MRQFFPIIKVGSWCGNLNAELLLTDRTYVCKQCEMIKDRDVNTAENLNRAGLARIYACGPVCACLRAARIGRCDAQAGMMALFQ